VKKTILSVLLCLNLFCATAQDIPCNIQKSEVFKDEYRDSYIKSVEEDGNGGIVICRTYFGGVLDTRSNGYYFEHYNSDMKLINEFEYALGESHVAGVIVKDGKISIIEFSYDKKTKLAVCSADVANLNDFKFSKKELFTLTKKEIEPRGFSNPYNKIPVMVANKDNTAFVLSIDINDLENKNEMHKIYVFDMNFNLKIQHVFKRDVKDRKFVQEDIEISDDGNTAYILGKVKNPENRNKTEGGKYQYELTRITANDEKTQVFDTREHYAGSLKMIFKKAKVACVGFYSDKNDNHYKGLCYFDMDPATLQIKTSKFNPFTEQFMIDKYGKDKDKELKDITFNDIFLTTNNEIVFNAEESYSTGGTTSSGGSSSPIYNCDDIISAKLADNGDLIWARNINKRQGAYDTEFISYTSMVKGDEIFFFINTGEKVKALSDGRIQFNQKSEKLSNLNVIRINKDGEFDYKELLDDKDNEVPFMVSEGAVATNSNSIYFMGRRGKKKQLLKLTL
jgi:hypothetical protein